MSAAAGAFRLSRRQFLGGLGGLGAACCLGAESGDGGAAPEHEARHYESLPDGWVRCSLCPRRCRVADGRRGHCGVRENRGGRLVSLVYGRPCAQHVDPIEKKPFFHVYPGSRSYSIATVGCNIECKFCQNYDIAQASPDDIRPPYRPPEAIARAARAAGARTLAYTYTEPTVFYEYMADCARAGRDLGVDSVVVSNGFISDAALRDLLPLVKAIKIDLKAFTQTFYREYCSGHLEPVKNTLRTLASSGVWFEVVVLLIPTLNDSSDEIRRLSAWLAETAGPDVPLHFSRYHPAYKIRNLPPTPAATLDRARRLALAEGCRFVYVGNLPGVDAANTVCPGCGATLVRRHEYRILELGLAGGACARCGRMIPGVWA